MGTQRSKECRKCGGSCNKDTNQLKERTLRWEAEVWEELRPSVIATRRTQVSERKDSRAGDLLNPRPTVL